MRTPGSHTVGVLSVALLLAGCATMGGGTLPQVSDPDAAITSAEMAIADAQQSGAESLATAAIGSARQNLADAKAQLQIGNKERAALAARQAVADAIYAKEEARRAEAERRRTEARTALDMLPPPGGAP